MTEFENFKETLTKGGIQVTEYQGACDEAPDAIFPDWFTTHRPT